MPNALDSEAEEALYQRSRSMWHPVAFAEDVTDQPLPVRLLDEPLVLVRMGEEIVCFKDLCIHRGTALSLGKVTDGQLQCAYHGWEFDSTGACVLIPSRPQGSIPKKARVDKYACEEAAGLVWVCVEPPALFPLPEYSAWNDPDYRTVRIPLYDWNSSAARRIENFVDFSHFPFVHAGVLGDPDKPEIPDHPVIRSEHAITFELGVEEMPNELKGDQITSDLIQRQPSTYTISMPYTVQLDQPLGDGHHFQLFMASCPVGRKETRTFSWCSRNYDLDPSKDEDFVEFQRVILEQDRVVVEAQRPEEPPIDLSEELHIKGVDRVSIEYRQWLLEVASSWAAAPDHPLGGHWFAGWAHSDRAQDVMGINASATFDKTWDQVARIARRTAELIERGTGDARREDRVSGPVARRHLQNHWTADYRCN